MATSIKVLLADDHEIVRQGLRSMIQTETDMEVVGEAEDGPAAVRQAQERSPDVVVMDVGMPVLNGIEATREIVANCAAKVVVLSVHSDKRSMTAALRAGASAYLPKEAAFDELVLAVRTACAGKVYLSPRIASVLVEGYIRRKPGKGSPAAPPLSVRERDVLRLLATGRTTKEIASDLNVSSKTVETHRRQIMDKLDLYSVAELTKHAIRAGLTSVEA